VRNIFFTTEVHVPEKKLIQISKSSIDDATENLAIFYAEFFVARQNGKKLKKRNDRKTGSIVA
jgi:hypothetical protein